MKLNEIKSFLNYDEETGVFTWKVSRSNQRLDGDVAGSINDSGYRTIMIKGKNYRAHRLAWWFVTGEYPEHDIDHINGIRTDNRISNLRIDKLRLNPQNMHGAKKTSKSGIAGVHWSDNANKWRSQICINGKSKHIGYFETKEDAYEAYVSAKNTSHEFSTIGRYNNDASVQNVKP